jgi:tetratricopeptide (TPR) repeat protein
MKFMRTSFIIFITHLVLTAAAVAQEPAADPGVESKRLYSEGTQAYNLGEFVRAVDLFKQAYKVKADPVFLFNIAQSLRLSNQYDQAALFYRSFLRNMPQAPNKAEVEGRIKEMDDAAAKAAADAKAKADADAKAKADADAKAKADADARAKIPDPSHVHTDDGLQPGAGTDTPPPIYKKWWFWTGVGVAAVGITVAAVLIAGGSDEISPPDSTLGNSQVFKP